MTTETTARDEAAWCDGAIVRVTSTDVAREAGVSQSTVSLVLSGKGAGRVSAATTERVQATARRLGYRPNAVARSLRTGSAGALCLAVPDVTSPFFALLLRGASRAAAQAGFAVALVDMERRPAWEDPGVQRLRGAGTVDGFLLFGARPPVAARAPGVEPVVLVDSSARGFSSVQLDGAAGMRAVAEHVLDLGHVRIGHLAGPVEADATFAQRREAIDVAVAARGLPPVAREASIVEYELARAAAGRLLDAPQRPTVLVCDDDLLAVSAGLAARDRGLRIPEDLSLTGFDDLDLAAIHAPPLTTVRADAAELGETAVALLVERLADPTARARRVVQPVELVVRASTAPPP